jgi:hypothetical protein
MYNSPAKAGRAVYMAAFFIFSLLPLCQLPASVPDGSGGLITKPPGW